MHSHKSIALKDKPMIKKYRAYAKINLLLDVTGLLSNGYHSVTMLMQSIDLHDIITVELTGNKSFEIICNLSYIPTDKRNIAWKAAAAFELAAGLRITEGLRITLEKHIPSQAGMGGGSADAAAVLTALRELFRPGMTDEALLSIGAQVGADVPFCLLGGCCFAEGIGEILTPLPCLPTSYEIEVLKPCAGINTAKAYAALDQMELKRPQTEQAVALAKQGDWESLFPLCENVFEQAASLPGLAEYLHSRSARGARLARMTGSGSALYSIWREGAMPNSLPVLMACEGQFFCRAKGIGVEKI